MSLEVRPARNEADVAAALSLRRRVFYEEQGVHPAADRDGRDHEALHVVALWDGRVVGTARLDFDRGIAHLGRLAVDPSSRRRGIATALLETAERCARKSGARRVTLHAQVYTEDLYAKGGYSRRGKPFFEQGIEHVAMEKPLA